MGDLFNDDGEFQPDAAAAMSDPQLNLAVAQLDVDLDAARAAYAAGTPGERAGEKAALRDVMTRMADLRSWLRACGEAAGVRTPNVPVVELTEGN